MEFKLMDKLFEKYENGINKGEGTLSLLSGNTDSDSVNAQKGAYQNIIDYNVMSMQRYREQLERLQQEQSKFGVGSFEWNLFEEKIKEYEQGYIDAQLAIKDAIKSKYEFEFDMMDKRFEKYKKSQSDLDFEINILNSATDGKDFTQQLKYNEEMIGLYKDNIKGLNTEMENLIKQQNEFSVGSSEWNLFEEQLKNVKDEIEGINASIVETLANNKKLSKDKLSKSFENANKQLEEKLFGMTSDKAQEKLNKEKEAHAEYMSGLEKQHALEMLLRDVRKEKISDFDTQIDAMSKMDKLSRNELTTLQKKVDIKKMENALDDLKRNATTQQLVQKDGQWSFEYVADEDSIKNLEDQLTQAQIELLNWEQDLNFSMREKEMQDKRKFLDDLYKAQQKALNDEYKNSKEFVDELREISTEYEDLVGEYTETISTSFATYSTELNTLNKRLEALLIALSVDKTVDLNNANNNDTSYSPLNKDTRNQYVDKDGNVRYKSFDTGGYTGDFSGGKLAVLHEKELVLNKDDTKNFLDGMKFLKGISFSGISSLIGKISNKGNGNNDISQDIKIYAEFPNATNQDEIRKAIMSLPSSAIVKANSN